jgi:hypothetical protein
VAPAASYDSGGERQITKSCTALRLTLVVATNTKEATIVTKRYDVDRRPWRALLASFDANNAARAAGAATRAANGTTSVVVPMGPKKQRRDGRQARPVGTGRNEVYFRAAFFRARSMSRYFQLNPNGAGR